MPHDATWELSWSFWAEIQILGRSGLLRSELPGVSTEAIPWWHWRNTCLLDRCLQELRMDHRNVNSTSLRTWWECWRRELVIASVCLFGAVKMAERCACASAYWLIQELLSILQVMQTSKFSNYRGQCWRQWCCLLKESRGPDSSLMSFSNIRQPSWKTQKQIEGLCISLYQDFHHWCGNPSSDAQVAASYERDQLSQVSCHQKLDVIHLSKASISFLYFRNWWFWKVLFAQSLYVH